MHPQSVVRVDESISVECAHHVAEKLAMCIVSSENSELPHSEIPSHPGRTLNGKTLSSELRTGCDIVLMVGSEIAPTRTKAHVASPQGGA